MNLKFEMKNTSNQKGKIYLWKYPSLQNHLPGWNLTADKDGCIFLSGLCSEFSKATKLTTVRLRLSIPTLAMMNIPIKSAKSFNAIELTLSYKPSYNWELTVEGKCVTLVFGFKYIDALYKAINDISRGEGGYSIGGGEENTLIWVWRHH